MYEPGARIPLMWLLKQSTSLVYAFPAHTCGAARVLELNSEVKVEIKDMQWRGACEGEVRELCEYDLILSSEAGPVTSGPVREYVCVIS